jgi:putative transposase
MNSVSANPIGANVWLTTVAAALRLSRCSSCRMVGVVRAGSGSSSYFVMLLCCVDGLKGFPEAIEAIYPTTVVQTCIVHLIRHSLRYVPRREREQVARDLKPIYTAVDADAAQAALEAFDDKWGARFPVITQAWLNAWEYVTPFLAFPPELRRVVYTTNGIEALNRQLRKAIKTKGHFPNEEAARKLIYLAITNAVPAWTRTRNWTTALLAFKIHFGDRLPE